MTVLGERSNSGDTDSSRPTESDSFGQALLGPDNHRNGRRRGARVRGRGFSGRSTIRSRRERRRAWDVDAMRLPEPLLTARMASESPLTTSKSELMTIEPSAVPRAGSTRSGADRRFADLGADRSNDTADWDGPSVHAIDLSDTPRLIVRPAPAPLHPPRSAPKFSPAVPDLSAVPGTVKPQPDKPQMDKPRTDDAEPTSSTLLPVNPPARVPLPRSGSTTTPAPLPTTTPATPSVARFTVGRDQLPDPVQLATEPTRLPEALLAAVLGIAATMAAWGTAAPRAAWIPLAVLPAVGLIALLLPGGSWARVLRAAILLAAAAALPALAPSMTPVTLVVALAAVAVYPMLVSPAAGRVIILLTIGCLLVPLVTAALADGPTDFFRLLLAADGDPTTAVRLALGSGILVVALIGGSTMAARRTLTSTASLAVTRERTARAATARLGAAATCDLATGLPNREALLRAVTIALADGDRRRHPAGGAAPQMTTLPARTGRVGLVQIDIERFAELADSLGAVVADEVAEVVAERLRQRYPLPTLLARVSRHQFALMLTEATADGCGDLSRQVTTLMTAPVTTGVHHLSITCSMGAALTDPGLRTADELLQAADEAARAAQRSGRSRWVMFDQAVRAHALSQATLEIELRDAVRLGTIEVVFQPILGFGSENPESTGKNSTAKNNADKHSADDRIVGAESLARWTRTDGTVVEPERFIPMADELGLGVVLGLQVIQRSLEALIAWRHEGVDIDQVWVNLAPSQLEDPEFAHEVAAQLAIRGLAASSLVLEISAGRLTESEQCLSTLGMLRSLGIAVALDDFGRNGTSLTALRRLPISAVKLDPSLAGELGRHDAVPRAMAQLCRTLGLRVVIEGVETMVQMQGAREIEADAVQGFAIARPMSTEDITNLLTLRLPRDFRLH
jgi:diguanylate cyclase (GGDEF)-like protein